MKNQVAEMSSKEGYDVVLSSSLVLQVDQDKPVLVKLQGKPWVICRTSQDKGLVLSSGFNIYVRTWNQRWA